MAVASWVFNKSHSHYKLSNDNLYAHATMGKYTVRAMWHDANELRYIFVGYPVDGRDDVSDSSILSDECVSWFRESFKSYAFSLLNPLITPSNYVVDGVYRGYMCNDWLNLPNNKLVKNYMSSCRNNGYIRVIVFGMKNKKPDDKLCNNSFNRFIRTWG